MGEYKKKRKTMALRMIIFRFQSEIYEIQMLYLKRAVRQVIIA